MADTQLSYLPVHNSAPWGLSLEQPEAFRTCRRRRSAPRRMHRDSTATSRTVDPEVGWAARPSATKKTVDSQSANDFRVRGTSDQEDSRQHSARRPRLHGCPLPRSKPRLLQRPRPELYPRASGHKTAPNTSARISPPTGHGLEPRPLGTCSTGVGRLNLGRGPGHGVPRPEEALEWATSGAPFASQKGGETRRISVDAPLRRGGEPATHQYGSHALHPPSLRQGRRSRSLTTAATLHALPH